ncbi:acyl-CoA dehydrogenase family protein [Terrilactibacillus sp. S3-3]|nr:acyl-CoA dehydrogenase family protein [Terrilactibacillus sp. S3-3]
MDFKFSDEQIAIKTLAKTFVNEEMMPNVRKYDEEESFPEGIMQKLRECGLFNLAIPEAYGGPGIDKISHALIVEELARGCAGVTTSVEANSLSAYPILVGADEPLKKKYLSRLTKEGKYASFALTEPEAGSDVRGMSTTVRKVGDEYVLNGEKNVLLPMQVTPISLLF